MAKLNALIEINGAEYRKVNRDAVVGDVVMVTEEDAPHYVTVGGFYEVMTVDRDDDMIMIQDEDGDGYWLDEGNYEVYEKVAEPAQQYREVKRPAKVGERIKIVTEQMACGEYAGWLLEDDVVRATEAEVEVAKQALKYGDFTDGDYAQIVNATGNNASDSAIENAGKFVTVTRDIDGYRSLALRLPCGKFAGYANPDALRKVTREEYEAAVDPRNQFVKGDKVRLIGGGGTRGLRDYETGGIYTVSNPKTSMGSVEITGGGQPNAYAKPDQLEKVSAEESAEIEKWAKIGRKVNEFRCGDLVEITRHQNGAATGSYVEVISANSGYVSYAVGYVASLDAIRLIVPVEQRFDKTA